MEGFIEELAEKKAISIEDIALIRKYIATNYEDYSDEKKSQVLADAIHKVLDNNIPEIGTEYKQKIKHDLLRNMITKKHDNILLLDVLNVCIMTKNKSSEFVDNITKWINFNVDNKVTNLELEKYDLELNNLYEPRVNSQTGILNVEAAVDKVELYRLEELIGIIIRRITKWGLNREKYILCFLVIFLLTFINIHNMKVTLLSQGQAGFKMNSSVYETYNNILESNKYKLITSDLPDNFLYKNINQAMLKKFLAGKKSILMEEPYFSTIIAVAKGYNLNPLVLFAITGQEQGFVAKTSTYSKVIANNPFNVYHSWKKYNTNINDASRIVCVTIINLSKNRPLGETPFKWINRKYAEDPNWSRSVKSIYNNLERNNLMLR